MTDRNESLPECARQPPPTFAGHTSACPAPVWVYPLIGLLQGIALWLVEQHGDGAPAWRSPEPWRSSAYLLALTLPLAWYLGDGASTAWRGRLAAAIAIGLLAALVGAHLGATADLAQYLASGVLAFTLIALCAALPLRRHVPAYPRLFEYAWRNALAVPLAALLTGVLWMLLWAAAWLMHSIDLDFMLRLIARPAFRYPVTCAAFGLAMGAVLGRADLLLAVRRFWLTLNAWFLPLILMFALIWLASLCFTGVEALFATRRAAQILFWFCLLGIVFANAAVQDGREPPALPPALGAACRWAWLAMPVLVVLGDWALWQRVRQHGWSNDRIWAAVVGLTLTLHVLGYAASLLSRSRRMAALPTTNVTVALVKVLVLLLLVSPLADSRRLAIDSQVTRLLDGRVTVGDFDWNYLRQDPRYGQPALARLAALETAAEPGVSIARRAIREQKRIAEQDSPESSATRETREASLRRVPVLPADSGPVDAALLRWLAADERSRRGDGCIRQPQDCLFWLTNLDGNRAPEALLIEDGKPVARVRLYAQQADGWREQGRVDDDTLTLGAWREAILAEAVEPVQPLWPDLMLHGKRMAIRR